MPLPPGSPQGMIPRGEDWIARRFEDMERKSAADIASVAQSFASTVADLQEQQDATLALVNAQLSTDATVVNSGALTLTNTETTIVTTTLTIPAGYTKALVVGIGSIGVLNPTASSSSFAGRVYIEHPVWGSSWGPRWFQRADPSFDAGVYPNHQANITGVLAGSIITVRMVCLNTGTNWGATAGGGTLNVHVFYTR